jgi:heme/copper-type cytochrome/quinol oxidase subunit 2
VNGALISVWMCAAIAAAVFAAMIVSIVKFGRSQATEILWTLIPIAIVLATAIPAVAKL